VSPQQHSSIQGLLKRAAQQFHISKMSFLHQSELVAPNVTQAQFVFHHTSIPVIEHGEHHEIQFM
jgi:hypothetical protein